MANNALLRMGSKLLKLTKSGQNALLSMREATVTGKSTSPTNSFGSRQKLLVMGALTGTAGLLLYTLDVSIEASGGEVHPAKQSWSHRGILSAIDKEGVRRGYQVYKEVCSSCHSLNHIAYRNLVGVCMTESEAKAEAEGIMVKDGPDEEGNYFDRPGKLSDHLPSPYPNEDAARSANNGSYPPDLSYIVNGRKGGENYIFSLLTGYCEPPAGVVLRDGQYYNPYFPGGAISMGQVITNEVISYADENVEASASQIAKDVVTFLKWTSEPESDFRKLLLIKVVVMGAFLIGISYYIKRFKWSTLKSRKIFYVPQSTGSSMGTVQAETKIKKEENSCDK